MGLGIIFYGDEELTSAPRNIGNTFPTLFCNEKMMKKRRMRRETEERARRRAKKEENSKELSLTF